MRTLFILALVFSTEAFAGGGSSIGPSACSFADVVCHTEPVGSIPEYRTYVCVFTANGFALLSPDFESEDAPPYQVSKVPTSGRIGAPLVYQGDGFTLQIETDVPQTSDGGYPATLSVPKYDLSDEALQCWLQAAP